MSEDRVRETKLAEQQARVAEARGTQPSGHLIWKIIGGAAIALVAVGVLSNLYDIRRYIRISSM